MAGAVLLQHDLPDGSSHFDLLIERPNTPGGPLVSFRVDARIDLAEPGASLMATRLPDHRNDYLTYEGPVSGGRGEVRRVVSARVLGVVERDRGSELELDWGAGPLRLIATPTGNNTAWRIRVVAPDSAPARVGA